MIVACGEALVDLMPGTVAGELVYRPVLGGSLFNVALGVARLGGRAGYLWELSTDTLGCAFHARLTAEGVDCAAVRRAGRATPVAIVDLTGPEPRYNIADPDRVMHDTAPPALPPRTAVLVIGSAVLAQEPVGTALERLAGTAPLVAIDYNVRRPSITDLAAYRGRLWRLSARAGIAKASTADFAMLGEPDPAAAMAGFVAAGAGLAVLTRGADGASAWTAAGRADVPTLARDIVDTVGAGDAFMAGLLAALQAEGRLSHAALCALDDAELARLMTEAQCVAAATCGRKGAVMPAASELGVTAFTRAVG